MALLQLLVALNIMFLIFISITLDNIWSILKEHRDERKRNEKYGK